MPADCKVSEKLFLECWFSEEMLLMRAHRPKKELFCKLLVYLGSYQIELQSLSFLTEKSNVLVQVLVSKEFLKKKKNCTQIINILLFKFSSNCNTLVNRFSFCLSNMWNKFIRQPCTLNTEGRPIELHSVRILYNPSPRNLFSKFNDKFYSSSVVIFHFAGDKRNIGQN